jgi:hypothetical protein
MFRFKPTSQSVERYHTVVSYTLNMEDLISKYIYIIMKFITHLKVHFINELTEFWPTLYSHKRK